MSLALCALIVACNAAPPGPTMEAVQADDLMPDIIGLPVCGTAADGRINPETTAIIGSATPVPLSRLAGSDLQSIRITSTSPTPGAPWSGETTVWLGNSRDAVTSSWVATQHVTFVKAFGAAPCFECHTETDCSDCHVRLSHASGPATETLLSDAAVAVAGRVTAEGAPRVRRVRDEDDDAYVLELVANSGESDFLMSEDSRRIYGACARSLPGLTRLTIRWYSSAASKEPIFAAVYP